MDAPDALKRIAQWDPLQRAELPTSRYAAPDGAVLKEKMLAAAHGVAEKYARWMVSPFIAAGVEGDLYSTVIDHVEKALVTAALKQCDDNQTHAARLLGIERNTLRVRMLKFGMLVQ